MFPPHRGFTPGTGELHTCDDSDACCRRGRAQHVLQHRRGEPAGEGVLLADVVAAEQVQRPRAPRPARRAPRARNAAGGAAPSSPRRPAPAAAPASRTRRARRPPAARGSRASSARSQAPQVSRSCRRRLVVRRRAVHGRGDPGAAQRQPVAGVHGRRLVGQPHGVQRREQHVAGAVAGEHPAGAVRPVRGGREARRSAATRRRGRGRAPGVPSTPDRGTRPASRAPPAPASRRAGDRRGSPPGRYRDHRGREGRARPPWSAPHPSTISSPPPRHATHAPW